MADKLDLTDGFDSKFISAHGDDTDHRRADAVKHRLHPRQAPVHAVSHAQ